MASGMIENVCLVDYDYSSTESDEERLDGSVAVCLIPDSKNDVEQVCEVASSSADLQLTKDDVIPVECSAQCALPIPEGQTTFHFTCKSEEDETHQNQTPSVLYDEDQSLSIKTNDIIYDANDFKEQLGQSSDDVPVNIVTNASCEAIHLNSEDIERTLFCMHSDSNCHTSMALTTNGCEQHDDVPTTLKAVLDKENLQVSGLHELQAINESSVPFFESREKHPAYRDIVRNEESDCSTDSEPSSVSLLSSSSSSTSTDSSSEDVSSDSSSDSIVQPKKKQRLPSVATPKERLARYNKRNKLQVDLPPVENLSISVDEKEMQQIGVIHSIVDQLVVVQSFKDNPALNIDSILFLDSGKPLGKIYEVFGPVNRPMYSLSYESAQLNSEQCISNGVPVFCVPTRPELTGYVFLSSLSSKGSDASWEKDVEPPVEFLDFSDDDAEKRAKGKNKHRQSSDCAEMTETVPVKRYQRQRDQFCHSNSFANGFKYRSGCHNAAQSLHAPAIRHELQNYLHSTNPQYLQFIPPPPPPPSLEMIRPPPQEMWNLFFQNTFHPPPPPPTPQYQKYIPPPPPSLEVIRPPSQETKNLFFYNVCHPPPPPPPS